MESLAGGGAAGEGQDYLVSTTPEYLAVFISIHSDTHRITVKDCADRLLLDVCGGIVESGKKTGDAHEDFYLAARVPDRGAGDG